MYGINIQLGAGQGFTQQDMQNIKAMGFDTIRLSPYWRYFQPTDQNTVALTGFTGPIAPSNTSSLDQYITWATALGLNVIINLVWSDSYPPPSWAMVGVVADPVLGIGSPQWERLLTSGSIESVGFINTWKAIATRYTNLPNVMFELFNEPSIRDKTSAYPGVYATFAETIIDAIEAVETVAHLKIVMMLVAGQSAEEVVDEQRDIARNNTVWATHMYTPWGNYDPTALNYGYDYTTGTWGWITNDKYVYWRMRRCSDKVTSWGKQLINTEFGKGTNYTGWDIYLTTVLTNLRLFNAWGWVFHAYDKGDPNGFSVVDAAGNTRPQVLAVLTPFMTAGPPPPAGPYNLTISANTGGTTDPVPGIHQYAINSEPQVTAIPSAGYFFVGWSLDNGTPTAQNPITVTMTTDHVLAATFALLQSVSVTVWAGANGNVSPSGSISLLVGQIYPFTATPNLGYHLDHWDLAGANKGSTNPLQLTITAAMNGQTLTALFTATPPAQVTVIIAVSGNGTTDIAPGSHQFNVGDSVTITATPASGYTFNRWTLDGTVESANPLLLTITADMQGRTLTAEFAAPPAAGLDLPTIGAAALAILDAALIGYYAYTKVGGKS